MTESERLCEANDAKERALVERSGGAFVPNKIAYDLQRVSIYLEHLLGVEAENAKCAYEHWRKEVIEAAAHQIARMELTQGMVGNTANSRPRIVRPSAN